jgi:hypothetical protein
MKSRIAILAAALALGLSLPALLLAGSETAKSEKPSISATQKMQVVTVVEAIDYEAKTVTLKGPQGNTQTITAKNTPNLEEVQVGDQVNVEYLQNVTIEVFANDGAEPSEGVMTAKAVNAPDQAPGGVEMTTRVVTATVEEINLEANTFKLNAAVGDLVVATYTEAVAIYLAEVPNE